MAGYLFLVLALTLNAAANVLLKVGAGRVGSPGDPEFFRRLLTNPWLLAGLLMFALNVMLYVAALTRLHEPDLLLAASLAFLAVSLCASSAYLLNDLLDLPNDRRHPRKKNRPLASGQISIIYAMVLVPGLLACGIAVGLLLPWSFVAVLTLYYVLTSPVPLTVEIVLAGWNWKQLG